MGSAGCASQPAESSGALKKVSASDLTEGNLVRQSVVFNGKFFNAPPTGVQRVAREIIGAVSTLIDAEKLNSPIEITICRPPAPGFSAKAKRNRLNAAFSKIFSDIIWEQFRLYFFARRSILVNLCNVGPVFHRRSVTMIHDAQVYITPQSYAPAFRLWYRWLQPRLGRSSLKILTVSEYSKQQLVEHGIAEKDKIVVIYNGIDHILHIDPNIAFVEDAGLAEKPFVLALSSTQRHKNIGILFRAFSSPELAGSKLVLFGSATRGDFEKLGHHVPPNIVFLGRVSDSDLVALMMAASAYACPSLTEGFGMPPLEAMALGCPAIIAPCGALHEICGDHALLADPDKPSEWIAQISKAINNGLEIDALRLSGRAHALTFTWDRAARSLCAVLGELVSQH